MESFASPTLARRWRTAALDTIGFFAIIWSIPLVIVIVGAPIALALFTIRMIFGWAVAQ